MSEKHRYIGFLIICILFIPIAMHGGEPYRSALNFVSIVGATIAIMIGLAYLREMVEEYFKMKKKR